MLVAVQLLRNGFSGRIVVIEPREKLGTGLAYSTPFNQHLLNVPAGKMSALPAQPSHFLEWLRARHWPDADADSFASRRLYGVYLHDLLEETLREAREGQFSHMRGEAIGFEADPKGARLTLGDGNTIHAGKVVLAVGNPASSVHSPSRNGLENSWHLSPWFGDALRVRFAGERILIIGTGLTGVDAALALLSQQAACQVYLLSRRGILPAVHNVRLPKADPPRFRGRGHLRTLLREVREEIKASQGRGLCWRATVDALRAISNDLWLELPIADRQRFLRHLKRYWEPHRHRMAPQIRAQLDWHLASGGLQTIAGRLDTVSCREGVTQARILLKSGGERTLDVDRTISCTGVAENYADSPRLAIRSMIETGLALVNDLGSGFRTDRHGALLDARMVPSSVFFTLGPPRRGELFETTAVPEIRVQAEALANHLAAGTVIAPLKVSIPRDSRAPENGVEPGAI